ncbi:type II toxin-antitoxin system RelB/DinJ family antitoxin [Agrobacterium rosae]|uniref:Type II toxin-antitoxin system RelB/DinJ family antitoxin n=1 Tax=Agrobacterium rosae TaxID=1972867 RepID=A0AAW9FL49_9HYPH|nr:type II toxin-antitoxin system RelB/DinJ family antitoxin [Agrobacterium rosae]MDX8305881.1 type II toxin-antitoxin system RelB/DinJ family antitoxin [Agrobacterium rosae]
MKVDSVVRARIDTETKDIAAKALADMGLSVSDYIRMALVRVARDKAIPFAVKVPNAETVTAMEKTARGEDVHRAKDAADLFKQLEI